jgi:hypothetical protein
MFGLLNEPYFVLLILFYAAVIAIGALVTALNRVRRIELNRVRRAEFARLQNELKALSKRVGALEAAEQRRFVRKINSTSEGAEATDTTGWSGQPEEEREGAVSQ